MILRKLIQVHNKSGRVLNWIFNYFELMVQNKKIYENFVRMWYLNLLTN